MGRIRRRDRVSAFAGAGALGFAVFAVGGAFPWTQAVVAALLAIALAAQLTSRRQLDRISPLVVLLGLATALTALQLIPLPGGLDRVLDPLGTTLRDEGAALVGRDAWPALTLDPAGTLRALTFHVIVLAGGMLALRLTAGEHGRHAVLTVVAFMCGLVAVTVGVHELLGAHSLFGVYTPAQANPPVLGPLLNPNHLGSLMAFGAVLCVGLFLYHRQSGAARTVWAVTGLACGAVAFASLSRGAVVALLIGVAITLAIAVAQRLVLRSHGRARRRFLTTSLPIGIVATCALILVVYASAGNVGTQLAETSLQEVHEPRSKFMAWRSAEALIQQAPWTGVGRGAFEPAFTRVHPPTAFTSVSHLENEYIQAVVDWGLPGAMALAAALAWLCVVAVKRWRDGPLAAGSIGALAVVAIHSNVDFGIELLGLALPVVAVAATLVYVPMRDAGKSASLRAMVPRAGFLALLLAAGAAVCLPHARSVGEDHDVIGDRAAVVTPAQISDSIARHPLDYIGFAAAAEHAVQTGDDPRAVRLLNHALRLHPTHPGLHRMAARFLHRTGHDAQAASEYAAALRGTTLPGPLLTEVVATLAKPALIVEAIPLDYRNLDLIARSLTALDQHDVAIIWLDRVLALRPRDLIAARLLSTVALARKNLPAAERAARRRVEIEPSTQARLQLAKVLFELGRYAEVVPQLEDVERWHGRVEDLVAAWFLLCDSRAHLDSEAATRCLRYFDAQGILNQAQRTEVKRRLEELAAARAGKTVRKP